MSKTKAEEKPTIEAEHLTPIEGKKDSPEKQGEPVKIARAAAQLASKQTDISRRAEMVGAMQGAVGNNRLSRMLEPNTMPEEPMRVQPMLAVSAPEDAQEQEAQRTSETVVRRMTDQPRPVASQHDTERMGARTAGQIPAVSPAPPGAGVAVSAEMEDRIQSMRGGGQPLADKTRAAFEGQFGQDFSHVRVHTDDRADSSARNLNARAYTTDQDIVFASGEYAPQTAEGERLLGHELTHVVQQTGKGSHRPLVQRQAKWWEEQISTSGERALYIRPIGQYYALEQLLRRVDVQVIPNPSPKKVPDSGKLPEALKKAPGQPQSENYIDARLLFSQWTPKEVKKAIDGIFPLGMDNFVTAKEMEKVKKVVEKHRKKHLNTFSMLQGTEMANCENAPASHPTCIGTMNLAVQKLYGERVIPRTADMGPTGKVTESIDYMRNKALTSDEKQFPAIYKGSGKRFQILSESDVDLKGAGAWLVNTVNAEGPGVHVFLFSVCKGFHSVTILVLKNKSGVSIAWKDQVDGVVQLSPKEFDAKMRYYCTRRYRRWVADVFQKKYKYWKSKEDEDYDQIKDDSRTPAVENEEKANIIDAIGGNLIVKLRPP
jgi:hypothetical protein